MVPWYRPAPWNWMVPPVSGAPLKVTFPDTLAGALGFTLPPQPRARTRNQGNTRTSRPLTIMTQSLNVSFLKGNYRQNIRKTNSQDFIVERSACHQLYYAERRFGQAQGQRPTFVRSAAK